MADDEKNEEKGKSGGGILPIINLVLLVLVLAVGGFIAWKLMSMETPPEAPTAKVEQTDQTTIPEAEDETDVPTVYMVLDNITVNLADTDQSRFLRTKIKLEVRNEEAKVKVDAKIVKVRDLVIRYLMSKKFSEIRTPQGQYKLKEELVWRMNQTVGGKPIIDLFLDDFVSQ
ncbi:MAG: flagellar basal body-associated FliL family protein [Mariprofundus sp.]|nr:flagellar basal body-associated FliL family protein [Mariprofundus sp.]